MDPTIEGFTAWVQNIMGVPVANMPDAATLQTAFDEAMNYVFIGLSGIPCQPTSPTIYAMAVYNLGGAFLVDFAQDVPPSTYWTDLRNKLNINAFQPGIINSAADQGTSEGSFIPSIMQGLTMFDLQLLKSPWGRAYLAIAGEWGTLWGITV